MEHKQALASAERVACLAQSLEQALSGYVTRKLLQDDDLDRFWHELQTPMTRDMWFGTDRVVGDAELWCENTVVLGEAQSGKSSVLKRACLANARAYLAGQEPHQPALVDLGVDLDPDLNVRQHLHELRAELGELPVRLFIDSVDEPVRIKGPKFVNSLVAALKTSFPDVPLVIASRRWALGRSDLEKIRGAARVVTTDMLHQGFYSRFFQSKEPFAQFISEVRRLGLTHFLSRALDGIGLVQSFIAASKLATTRAELFQHRVQTAFRAASSVQDADTTPSSFTLEELAKQVAVLATLTGRISWTLDEVRSQQERLSSKPGSDSRALASLLGTSLFRRSPKGLYAFSRDEDRERLAAAAVRGLPLRKMKILVGMGPEGIPVSRRGFAQHLAGFSETFFRYLLEVDPIAAVFTEQLAIDNEDQLLRTFFEFVVSHGLVPWQKLPPTDEELQQVLYFRRPANPDVFLLPWLRSSDDIAQVWGTLAAKIWRVSEACISELTTIALSKKATKPARKYAVQAIVQTENRKALIQLGSLHWSRDSEARAYYIEGVVKQRNLSAIRIITLFRGGRREKLIGKMMMLAKEVAAYLPSREVNAAFELVVSRAAEFDQLSEHLTSGILTRATADAIELDFSTLIRIFEDDPYQRSGTTEALRFLSACPARLSRFVIHLLDANVAEQRRPVWASISSLARLSSDVLLQAIPSNVESLDRDRLDELVRQHFQGDRSKELKNLLETRFSIPLPVVEEYRPGLVNCQFDRAIGTLRGKGLPDDAENLSQLAADIFGSLPYCGDGKYPSDLSTENTEFIRDAMGKFWENHDLAPLSYNPNGSWCETYHHGVNQRELFILALAAGVQFPADRLESYFTIYGFGNEYLGSGLSPTNRAATDLFEADSTRWERAVRASLATPRPAGTIQYLTELKSPIFIDQARRLLGAPQSARADDLYWVEDYWRALAPSDMQEVLFEFYLRLRDNDGGGTTEASDQEDELTSRILLELCDDSFMPAWDELQKRLQDKDFPVVSGRRRHLPIPPTDEMADALVHWFPQAVELRFSPLDLNELPSMLLKAVQGRPRSVAISIYGKMRDATTVEWAKRLACKYLFEATYGRSEQPPETFDVDQLRELLYTETGYAANGEHSLFETILEALERESLQYQMGEGIEGYWNNGEGKAHKLRKTPKNETPCQNVLWHNLRTRLEGMGISGVKERPIQAGRMDFWCEVAIPGKALVKVPIELKVTTQSSNEAWLVDSMESQLLKRYMKPAQCGHGIFIVLWFKCDIWKFPNGLTIETLRLKHEELASRLLDEHGVTIRPIVLDLTTPSSDTFSSGAMRSLPGGGAGWAGVKPSASSAGGSEA